MNQYQPDSLRESCSVAKIARSFSESIMKLRLLYHGHRFDGVASVATFTRFYKERIHPEAEVNYTGLLHRPGNLFDLVMFDGDENAIVDFKYAASEQLA